MIIFRARERKRPSREIRYEMEMVYIIECLDGTYYTGCTWNLINRFEQHISKLGSKYIANHGVKKLVYYEAHDNLAGARERERQIKDWSQEKKRKLISGKWKEEW